VTQNRAAMEPAENDPPPSPAGKPLADDPALLALMVEDAAHGGPLWTATAYWRGYSARILRELKRVGLSDLRTNQTLLKGFATGGMPLPELPAAPWKRALWDTLHALPGFRQIIGEYRRVLAAEYARHRETRRQHARVVMDEIARAFPDLRPPAGLSHGGADDAFSWRGHTIVPAFAMYLSRVADFYARVPARDVTAIIEIGPGLGFNSLAHIAINPALRVIVNVDIVPVLYLSTQFLKSIDGADVIDYRALRAREPIVVESPSAGVRIYQIAPWLLPRVQGDFDYFFNAFSFQEMEPEVCRNYAVQLLRLVERGVLLHEMTAGHKRGAGGQQAPVTLSFLESLFSEKFPNVARLDGFWPHFYGGHRDMTRLLTK
jgi:putative sugar O-methyltransferase